MSRVEVVVCGVGVGVGEVLGVGVGVAVGLGVELGLTLPAALGLTLPLGEALEVAVLDGSREGEATMLGLGEGEASATSFLSRSK